MASVMRLRPLQYQVLLDLNTQLSRLVVGPLTWTKEQHEVSVIEPTDMVIVPAGHYCRIRNPVVRDADGNPVLDGGSARIQWGLEEIRLTRPPFPLYPGEELVEKPTPLQVVQPFHALRVRAVADCEKPDGSPAAAGDEWLFQGPGTYVPKVTETIAKMVTPHLIAKGQALRVRAVLPCTDYQGRDRRPGEHWLVRSTGHYVPALNEEVVGIVDGRCLTQSLAVHVKALDTFVDADGVQRQAGEEWLVTHDDYPFYIPPVQVEITRDVRVTVLHSRQYCVVVNPWDANARTNQLGKRELRQGPAVFFRYPGERLENDIEDVHVLTAEETLLLRAAEAFQDGTQERSPGEQWLLEGPCDYVPPVEVEIVERRKVIALDRGEGIYVRDLSSGKVSLISGRRHMLQAHEQLWEKHLPKAVEELIALGTSGRDQSVRDRVVSTRTDKSRAVTYRVPYNAACQIYDYKLRQPRIVFGPKLVMLGPDEEFTLLSLSGGNPKRPGHIRSLCLFLGPDFMTDEVTVETADHARLKLRLAYSWIFDVNRDDDAAAAALFSIADFVGDACSAIASKVRGAVAAVNFDAFHKGSVSIIREAVFGVPGHAGHRTEVAFPNHLRITGIDVQSVEPIDQKTKDSLAKSVQQAIEITTKSQEAKAKHDADTAEQVATGELDRIKIQDACKAEAAKTALLRLQTHTAIIEAIGDHTSDAEAKKTSTKIRGEAAVGNATLQAKALAIRRTAEVEMARKERAAELKQRTDEVELEVSLAEREAEIEVTSFRSLVEALGAKTIQDIALAGPAMQAQLLEGLGLQGYLITDGTNPVNLLDFGKDMVRDDAAGAGAQQ